MKASLTFHHIKHGGVPMTATGAKRFAYFALQDGHSKESIIEYLKEAGFEYKEGEN